MQNSCALSFARHTRAWPSTDRGFRVAPLAMPYYNDFTVLPRKERHAGIIEGDHFHENGLMVLYRHAGINRGMLFPEIFALFLTLPISFKYE